MGKGSILAWLNSDDLYLPGCIRAAVNGFLGNSSAGAVYGEGYLIDYSGTTSCRFPHTEAFNLWKLMYLSDYILQQSVYFRKHVLDDLGYLDEDLHYTMDWDILIRIGKKYQIEYVPEYMGCLREYPEAKSSAGGIERAREIRRMLQRHTGLRIAPGYVVYGLDTYYKLCCDRIDRALAPALKPVAEKLKSAVRLGTGLIIHRTIRNSQGLYSDGWAAPSMHYMLPPGSGCVVIEGSLPNCNRLERQTLSVTGNGRLLGRFDVPIGDFQLKVPVPFRIASEPLRLKIEAAQWLVPQRFRVPGDRRRLAYRLRNIRWEQSSTVALPFAFSASSGT
jgi:hypothetical protein